MKTPKNDMNEHYSDHIVPEVRFPSQENDIITVLRDVLRPDSDSDVFAV